jgi:hypothetical protein
MFIFAGLISAIIFVSLGYFAFWTAMRQGTQPNLVKFGKIMGIILFVIGGLALIFSFTGGPFMGHMMGGGMFPYKGWGRMGMSKAAVEDIYNEIEELDEQIEDLEQRVNEMPVFVQDLVKQNIERMKK